MKNPNNDNSKKTVLVKCGFDPCNATIEVQRDILDDSQRVRPEFVRNELPNGAVCSGCRYIYCSLAHLIAETED